MESRRLWTAVAFVVVALLAPAASASAQTVNKPPTACITQSPGTPVTLEKVAFNSICSSDPEGRLTSRAWDIDNDGQFDDGTGQFAWRTWSTPGTYTVRLRVVDDRNQSDIETWSVVVKNRPPTARFTVSPTAPLTKQTVTFTSTSVDLDGKIASYAWDLDGDGAFNDGTGPTATKSWPTPGARTVRLRVTDNLKWQSTATVTVTIGNRAPVASFAFAPAQPVAGDPVELTSTASDEDGTLASQTWDLDNDGAYDDASGAKASFVPPQAGAWSVGLRVVDDKGAARTIAGTVVVGERPATLPDGRSDTGHGFDVSTPIDPPVPSQPEATAPVAQLGWLTPFPIVRMRGRTTRRGAQLWLLSVRAPHGAVARVRCKGRHCPARSVRKAIKTRSGRGSTTVRFSRFERFLPAGVELHVAVSKDGLVGKYTLIRIRRVAVPVRVDRCLLPGSTRPAACPESP